MMQNKFNKRPEKEFPLQDVHYDSLDLQKKSVIKKLLYLYVFYASKGSKHSFSELQQHNYMELMTQIWAASAKPLFRNKGMWRQIQILYYTKGSKNKLSFAHFLQLLPSLSYYYQPDLSQEEAMKSLIYHCRSVYENNVLPEIDSRLINTRQMIGQDTRSFLSKLAPDLIKLYKVYFPHEITLKSKAKQFKALSFQCFTLLLKQFEIFPKLLSARQIFYIFFEACEAPQSDLLHQTEQSRPVFSEMGSILTLSNFIETLLVISRRAFPKLKNIENEEDWQDQQKFILRTLLQYMQTIKMSNTRKTKFMHERMCFIVLEEHPPEEMVKTFQVKDKVIKETVNSMGFYGLIDKIKF